MPSGASDKIYIDANRMLEDAFLLGKTVLDSGYRPTLLLALWRGGTPVGIAIQELLAWQGIPHQHYPLKTRYYSGINQRREAVEIEGLEPILGEISTSSRLLIVDDVFDTGVTIDSLIGQITRVTPVQPAAIRVATPWFKPANNRTGRKPDYFLHQTEDWIVFPHELQGLTGDEVKAGKPRLSAMLDLQ